MLWIILFLAYLTNHSSCIIFKDYEDNEKILNLIHDFTLNNYGSNCYQHSFVSIKTPISMNRLESTRRKLDLSAMILSENDNLQNSQLVSSVMKSLLLTDSGPESVGVVSFEPHWYFSKQTKTGRGRNSRHQNQGIRLVHSTSRDGIDKNPWYFDRYTKTSWRAERFIPSSKTNRNLSLRETLVDYYDEESPEMGWWTYPYFACERKAWLISYVAPISSPEPKEDGKKFKSLKGLIEFDADISHLSIDQCDGPDEEKTKDGNERGDREIIYSFLGTHKCHKTTMDCHFLRGKGWVKGGYQCSCKTGYYGANGNSVFNGTLIEVAWNDKAIKKSDAYETFYKCERCAPGCDSCVDDKPCLASYHWTFRYILLFTSVTCIAITFSLMILVYNYRKLKVFKLASPTFLCITLLGCSIMYLEMVAIFPVLNVALCVMTKWTRHLGFLITYSALLLKTWRVSLTFRVKSAHKLKLTDKQLLQWLCQILLVMIVYLASWTISDPPPSVDIQDGQGLKFKQCHYGWWDHSLAIGEVLFLLWGIKVCFNVRNVQTHFDEAKVIRWSIYNIAMVNVIMVTIHLLIFPHAGPDMKYFLGFVRTQLGTTFTILLVFGNKFLRVYKGTADVLDDRFRAKSRNFIIGIPLEDISEQKDVFLENEELKEEIQKLSGQVEYLKIVGMLADNPHLKSKKDGYFTKENFQKSIEHFSSRINQNGSMTSENSPPAPVNRRNTMSDHPSFNRAHPRRLESGRSRRLPPPQRTVSGTPPQDPMILVNPQIDDEHYGHKESAQQIDLVMTTSIRRHNVTDSV